MTEIIISARLRRSISCERFSTNNIEQKYLRVTLYRVQELQERRIDIVDIKRHLEAPPAGFLEKSRSL
jgi:hypothetical protein